MNPPADTKVYDEAYFSYVQGVNPRRTQRIGKRAISGWKLIKGYQMLLTNTVKVILRNEWRAESNDISVA